ncbi:MAG: CoB--CoM heterodisulfide reductase iron-sulfur subunit B family protein [Promethearchaeia archaeon]
MIHVIYYPGCSLRNSYPEFEKSALEVCQKLDIQLEEIPEWNCCGVNFSLSDNIMRHLGAVRTLIDAQEELGSTAGNEITTLCSMCYNVLKRTNVALKTEQDTLENVNDYIDDAPNYQGHLQVSHFLQLLRDRIGFDAIFDEITKPLSGLKIAPYYGCALLRPENIAVDTRKSPTIMEEFIRALGATSINYPYKTECCGNYHAAFRKEIVEIRSKGIVESAVSAGADLIISPCPLCTYNLGLGVENLGKDVPVLFFTQVLAMALEVNPYLSPEREELVLKNLQGS